MEGNELQRTPCQGAVRGWGRSTARTDHRTVHLCTQDVSQTVLLQKVGNKNAYRSNVEIASVERLSARPSAAGRVQNGTHLSITVNVHNVTGLMKNGVR